LGGGRPRRIVLPRRRDFGFDGGEVGGKGHQQTLAAFAHGGDDRGKLVQGMELITHLLLEIEQGIALREALLQLIIGPALAKGDFLAK
jgi:hypothetical protein